jgi:hypothetical protein
MPTKPALYDTGNCTLANHSTLDTLTHIPRDILVNQLFDEIRLGRRRKTRTGRRSTTVVEKRVSSVVEHQDLIAT